MPKLRNQIKVAAPQAEELIYYGMPGYKYFGPLIMFIAQKNFCSLIIIRKTIIKKYAKDLKPFEISGTTIHFIPEKPLPAELVKKIVKVGVGENEERVKYGK